MEVLDRGNTVGASGMAGIAQQADESSRISRRIAFESVPMVVQVYAAAPA